MHSRPGVAEEEIIHHCKTGSLNHQEMLYKLFYGYAMGISLRYSLNRDDALEVTNDAFIKVFNSVKSYNRKPPSDAQKIGEALVFLAQQKRIIFRLSLIKKNQFYF